MNRAMERAAPRASADQRRVEQLAARLGTLQNRVIFAGECALGFLLTNRGIAQLARPARSNPIVSVVAYGSPDRLAAELRLLGLQPDRSRMPADLWRTPDGTRLELISPEGWSTISNPWYQYVLECTLQIQPTQGPAFRAAGAPAFLATHLFSIGARDDASTAPGWNSRMEDIVRLAIGRRELEREMTAAPPDVRAHVRDSLEPFLLSNEPLATVHAFLPRAVRSPLAALHALGTLRRIAGFSSSDTETALRSGAYMTPLPSPNPPK
jgi:hypothetical protein